MLKNVFERIGWNAVPAAIVVVAVGMVAAAMLSDGRRAREAAVGVPRAMAPLGTSRTALDRTVRTMEARLEERPTDGRSATILADALLRQARVTSDGGLAVRAETVLRRVLKDEPLDYEARRMLGVVYLAQHRFQDAIREATRARDQVPEDSSNYGVLGDAHVELGEYDAAFDAFQRMMDLRPGAPAYARAAYARELQGDLDGALTLMTMAADATSAHDPEGQAWHYGQLGNLLFQAGRLTDARRQYERARHVFPGHPYAVVGLARVDAAEGRLEPALGLLQPLLAIASTPELAAQIGDLQARLGLADEAEQSYALAERLEREGWGVEEAQPAALARLLAERDRSIDEALRLATEASGTRQDIFTCDALAWAQFKAGRVEEALASIGRAMRTGTRDRRILYHAAVIKEAAGDLAGARELARLAVEGHPGFDVLLGPAAAALHERLARS